MKQNFKIAALAFGIMAIAFIGCRKDPMNGISTQNTPAISDIQSLAVQAETDGANIEVTYNEATGEMTAANEGIASDYLATVEDFNADQSTVTGSTTGANTGIRANSFLRCLKGLNLDNDQITKVRIAMGDFQDCRASAIKRARAIHHSLQVKYKDLAAAQAKLLRDKTITKAEFDARMARLRNAFKNELAGLQLKEKLNAALKDCHIKFLRQLNGILTERQWKAFVACHRK